MTVIRLWDLPLRLFHWLLVTAVIGSVATIKAGGDWMVWHERFGLAVVGLLSFRIVWGFIGSRYARFSMFVRGPGAVVRYLRGQWQGLGHNPLGAWSVLALLGLFGFQAVSGLFANDEIAFNGPLVPLVSSGWSDTLSSWHRQTEWYLYGLVALHVAAVLYYKVVRKDNLLKPMITGRKVVPPEVAVDGTGGGPVALVVALAVAAVVVVAASGELIPPAPAPEPPPQNLGW
ncbi:cytochrome b/b6 domain-containing protein [Marinobacter bryozoorum]|uniref:cytochrome b/b6 domain-containing protein n=1 Tax=Marinobacter bryozoorum TaxID=256324 RepID=UPI0020052C7D|nr:cytochrome b/b6 domain-containing protein [Marinobacter bryozoorum]MCK7543119.1 cytochrome b/b6 domain-containing protein [Marinobacter bryozoorum]